MAEYSSCPAVSNTSNRHVWKKKSNYILQTDDYCKIFLQGCRQHRAPVAHTRTDIDSYTSCCGHFGNGNVANSKHHLGLNEIQIFFFFFLPAHQEISKVVYIQEISVIQYIQARHPQTLMQSCAISMCLL